MYSFRLLTRDSVNLTIFGDLGRVRRIESDKGYTGWMNFELNG